ncbi:acyclic terpene utilization AtuA family protein [Ferrovibrio sp.]|uniref:acyclic terpene utilization AtuA family protein n=1 Tax=Ferrovibrio sp. TaxID=1917215 RepID=UPI00261F3B71|nr:acyclic terpene utilization AtuA family protein [Ferrovibrio sp.]
MSGSSEKTIRIGGASAFWGDSMVAAPQLLMQGEVDYLIFDYLAEITMSIMARMRAKDPAQGYATDFVAVTMKRLLPELARRKVKVVANAGGVNPAACAAAIRALIAEAGLSLKVGVVLGDDLLPKIDALKPKLEPMQHGATVPERFMSANAYLGAVPIAAALKAGADIVVTGRCVDSALCLGPLLHEFGWDLRDFDRLAAGSLAGHIIECGAQASGGLFTDWRDVPDWDNIGYPIAEVSADGSFVVTKPKATGGLVSTGTVSEQLVYEIGDPASYHLPDVTCDFTAVKIVQVGENRVRVSGAKGRPPTDRYKVSATYLDGFRAVAHLTIGGIEAREKAERTAEAILRRTRRLFAMLNLGDYRATSVEVLGTEAMYGPHAQPGALASREVVLKLSVSHAEKTALDIFAREIAPAGTSFSPGTTGFFGGRPTPQPVVKLFSCFIAKAALPIALDMAGMAEPFDLPLISGDTAGEPAGQPDLRPLDDSPRRAVPLMRLAWARSGDKGDDSNIGIIARRPEYLPAIRAALTEEAVQRYFSHLVEGPVERFEWPGIHGLNFLLRHALGGGGIASLRNDPQGKAYAQMLLDYPVPVPVAWGLTDSQ